MRYGEKLEKMVQKIYNNKNSIHDKNNIRIVHNCTMKLPKYNENHDNYLKLFKNCRRIVYRNVVFEGRTTTVIY